MTEVLPYIIYNICNKYFKNSLDLKTFKLCNSSISTKFKYISVYCIDKKDDLLIIYEDRDGTNNISVHIDNHCVYGSIDKIYEFIYNSIYMN
jgi:hypothetical protein